MNAVQPIDALTNTLQSYLTLEQSNSVVRAYYFAEQAHHGQLRRSGEPYVTHPLAVAIILADMHMDHQSLVAAMLHDVIEDTGIPKSAIGEQFGAPVAELVDGVSKLTQMEFESLEEKQAENFQKMALAMARAHYTPFTLHSSIHTTLHSHYTPFTLHSSILSFSSSDNVCMYIFIQSTPHTEELQAVSRIA